MHLEYAKKMSKEETDKFYSFLNSKHEEKINTAQSTIENNPDKLIKAYHDFHFKSKLQMAKVKQEVDRANECFKKGLCECGNILKSFTNRYNGQTFMGCPDYLDETKTHRAWNYLKELDYTPIFKNWLSTIINSLDLKGKIHTKFLLMFFEANGLEDLQLKYCGLDSKILINRFTTVKKTSSEFELRQVEILRNHWPVVLYQFPIKYKYNGEKEKSCFIDILCSNDDEIKIYECKTDMYNVNEDQMRLYVDCIKYINTHLKINKKLTVDYLIEK